MSDCIVRLRQRHGTDSFFDIKDHVVFLPQDTTRKTSRFWAYIEDGKCIIDWKNYAGNLGDLTIDEVVEGAKVVIEYTPVPYGGKKPKGIDKLNPWCIKHLHDSLFIAHGYDIITSKYWDMTDGENLSFGATSPRASVIKFSLLTIFLSQLSS